MQLLEDDDLATGEELPINAPQEIKTPNTNLGLIPQLSPRTGSPQSLRPPAGFDLLCLIASPP